MSIQYSKYGRVMCRVLQKWRNEDEKSNSDYTGIEMASRKRRCLNSALTYQLELSSRWIKTRHPERVEHIQISVKNLRRTWRWRIKQRPRYTGLFRPSTSVWSYGESLKDFKQVNDLILFTLLELGNIE